MFWRDVLCCPNNFPHCKYILVQQFWMGINITRASDYSNWPFSPSLTNVLQALHRQEWYLVTPAFPLPLSSSQLLSLTCASVATEQIWGKINKSVAVVLQTQAQEDAWTAVTTQAAQVGPFILGRATQQVSTAKPRRGPWIHIQLCSLSALKLCYFNWQQLIAHSRCV